MYLHRLDAPRRSVNPGLNSFQSKHIEECIRADLQSIMDNFIVVRGYAANKKQLERLLYGVCTYLQDAKRNQFVESYEVKEAFIIRSMRKHKVVSFQDATFIAHSLIQQGLTREVLVKRKLPHTRSRRLMRVKMKADYVGVYHLQIALTIWGVPAHIYVDLYKDQSRA